MNETVKKIWKLSAVIVVAALIGVILGTILSSYELRFMFSSEYIGKIRGIDVYRTGEVNEENLGLHASMIEKAPEMLTKCCDKIYFTGTDLELPAQDSALGLTQGRTLFISTESFSTYVIYHELFHAYDNSNGEPSANSLEFINAYEANKQVIPVFAQYSSSFRSEFFAQAGAMYLIMPFELSIAAPETYRYYDEVLGLGKQKEMF